MRFHRKKAKTHMVLGRQKADQQRQAL